MRSLRPCQLGRGVTRLDGAQGKKQVWRPHVSTLQSSAYIESASRSHTRPKHNILDSEITIGSFLWLNGLRRSKIKLGTTALGRGSLFWRLFVTRLSNGSCYRCNFVRLDQNFSKRKSIPRRMHSQSRPSPESLTLAMWPWSSPAFISWTVARAFRWSWLYSFDFKYVMRPNLRSVYFLHLYLDMIVTGPCWKSGNLCSQRRKRRKPGCFDYLPP